MSSCGNYGKPICFFFFMVFGINIIGAVGFILTPDQTKELQPLDQVTLK